MCPDPVRATSHDSLFLFFFSLFINRMRPMEIMAILFAVHFLSAVRAAAARCKRPFALRPGPSRDDDGEMT